MNRFTVFSGRTPRLIGEKDLFQSAVCIPLIKKNDDYEILLQVRSSRIPDQPGDICLPGGHMEKGESAMDAAIRECCEELLIQPENITPVGYADIFHQDNLIIYPVVILLSDYNGSFSRDEVSEVFTVPVRFLEENEPEKYRVTMVPRPAEDFPYDRVVGGRNYKWRNYHKDQLFYQFGQRTIWGITARILYGFTETLRNERGHT